MENTKCLKPPTSCLTSLGFYRPIVGGAVTFVLDTNCENIAKPFSGWNNIIRDTKTTNSLAPPMFDVSETLKSLNLLDPFGGIPFIPSLIWPNHTVIHLLEFHQIRVH